MNGELWVFGPDQPSSSHGSAELEETEASPTGGVIDSQRQNHGKRRYPGFDAGKKTKGRKRHIIVDTLGLVVGLAVAPLGSKSVNPQGTAIVDPDYLWMSYSIDKIPLHGPDGYNVVVETPRGSRTKFAFDAETGLFRAKKLLAVGFAFPFAFGFFPSTYAEDGDPLDVLLLTDADIPMGSLVRCRLIGGIAMEEKSDDETRRNDRLLAVPLLQHQDRPPYELSDLPAFELKDIEDFLVAYQTADGKDTHIVARLDKAEAERVIGRAVRS